MKSSLSKAEKRVAIAKDVLAQIKAERLDVQAKNLYVEISYELAKSLTPNTQLQKELKTAECTVCALGACFISAVRKYNKCTAGDVKLGNMACWCGDPECDNKDAVTAIDRDSLTEKLGVYFTDLQMDAIERAFETGWCDAFDDDEGRLVAIMRNIVRNKGTFKPGDIR